VSDLLWDANPSAQAREARASMRGVDAIDPPRIGNANPDTVADFDTTLHRLQSSGDGTARLYQILPDQLSRRVKACEHYNEMRANVKGWAGKSAELT